MLYRLHRILEQKSKIARSKWDRPGRDKKFKEKWYENFPFLQISSFCENTFT